MTQTTHIQDCISLDPNGSTNEKPRKIEWLPAGPAACLSSDVVAFLTADVRLPRCGLYDGRCRQWQRVGAVEAKRVSAVGA